MPDALVRTNLVSVCTAHLWRLNSWPHRPRQQTNDSRCKVHCRQTCLFHLWFSAPVHNSDFASVDCGASENFSRSERCGFCNLLACRFFLADKLTYAVLLWKKNIISYLISWDDKFRRTENSNQRLNQFSASNGFTSRWRSHWSNTSLIHASCNNCISCCNYLQ